MDAQAQMLLQKSAIDEQTMLLEGIPDLAFGFHAQQAIEKLLKAILSQLGRKYTWTHYLDRLESELLDAGIQLPATPLKLAALNKFAMEFRYDDPPLPVALHRADVIATVKIIREFTLSKIAETNQ